MASSLDFRPSPARKKQASLWGRVAQTASLELHSRLSTFPQNEDSKGASVFLAVDSLQSADCRGLGEGGSSQLGPSHVVGDGVSLGRQPLSLLFPVPERDSIGWQGGKVTKGTYSVPDYLTLLTHFLTARASRRRQNKAQNWQMATLQFASFTTIHEPRSSQSVSQDSVYRHV